MLSPNSVEFIPGVFYSAIYDIKKKKTIMYPSYHAQPPLHNERQVEKPSKGLQTATETQDAVEHSDPSMLSRLSHPPIPVTTKLEKLGLATEPISFGKKRAMSPAICPPPGVGLDGSAHPG